MSRPNYRIDSGDLIIESCDGGGAKGYASASIIAGILERIPEYRPHAHGGTSIGGLIETLRAIGMDPGEIARIIREEGRVAFPKRSLPGTIWQRIKNFRRDGISQPLFEEAGLEALLKKYLGDLLLGEIADPPLLLTAADATAKRMVYMNSAVPPRPWPVDSAFDNCLEGAQTMLLRKGNRATSAAPGYYRPLLVRIGLRLLALIDGGVGANNPAGIAIAQFRHIFRTKQNKPIPLSRVVVVSIGTGKSYVPVEAEKVRGAGFLEWMRRKLISWLIDFPADATDNVVAGILDSGKYFRFNPNIPPELDVMDDTSPEFFEKMDAVIARYLQSDEFETKVRRLRDLVNRKAAA